MTKGKIQPEPATEGFSLISNQKLLALYSSMMQCRKIAENARQQLKRNGSSGKMNTILGHEAATVGATIDLLPHDTLGHSLWPEGALTAINPSVSIVASLPLAVSAARPDHTYHKVAVLFSSGKRDSQTSWLKALTQAADDSLPILFVSLDHPTSSNLTIEGNGIPLKRKGYSFPWINVDGNDVVAVYRVASEAITHARKGHGPTLIDCQRSANVDPLQNMRKYLIDKGLNPA
jgi:TPP-dependent pyruvate/acetoin dehydrogenase alpha subunit